MFWYIFWYHSNSWHFRYNQSETAGRDSHCHIRAHYSRAA